MEISFKDIGQVALKPKTFNANITITDAAYDRVDQLIKLEESDPASFRVFIRGGGCSGMQYGFKFENGVEDNDLILTRGTTPFIVDPDSAKLLDGSTVDYVKTLMSEQFVITNPTAATTCSCGKSFC